MVCDALGYRSFDKRLIFQAAKEAGLNEQEDLDFCEDNYKVRTFLDRIFGRQQVISTLHAWEEYSEGLRLMDDVQLTETALISLIQKAIQRAYYAGNMVIVGRGGQAVLQGYEDVLHVRVIAPLEDRIQRVKEGLRQDKQYGDSYDLRRQAQDMIEERDAASAEFIRRFYGLDWADANLYHLVINTGKNSLPQAANLIVSMVKELEPAEKPVQVR
jgi:cytidylate kinase